MGMFASSHPSELIKETIDGIREDTGEKLTFEEIARGLEVSLKTLLAIINQK